MKDELEKRREEHSVDEEGYCVFRRRPSIFVESHENEEPHDSSNPLVFHLVSSGPPGGRTTEGGSMSESGSVRIE